MFEINWDGASKCPSCDKGYLEMGEPRKLTRSQQRYQDYLDSVYYEAGDSFAFYLGIKGPA